ncbi:MAG: hypothetical protein Q8928_02040 [Bacteroidota bacterium]|nr:hypothetical protein [Bacteroidota bacterium]
MKLLTSVREKSFGSFVSRQKDNVTMKPFNNKLDDQFIIFLFSLDPEKEAKEIKTSPASLKELRVNAGNRLNSRPRTSATQTKAIFPTFLLVFWFTGQGHRLYFINHSQLYIPGHGLLLGSSAGRRSSHEAIPIPRSTV